MEVKAEISRVRGKPGSQAEGQPELQNGEWRGPAPRLSLLLTSRSIKEVHPMSVAQSVLVGQSFSPF